MTSTKKKRSSSTARQQSTYYKFLNSISIVQQWRQIGNVSVFFLFFYIWKSIQIMFTFCAHIIVQLLNYKMEWEWTLLICVRPSGYHVIGFLSFSFLKIIQKNSAAFFFFLFFCFVSSFGWRVLCVNFHRDWKWYLKLFNWLRTQCW